MTTQQTRLHTWPMTRLKPGFMRHNCGGSVTGLCIKTSDDTGQLRHSGQPQHVASQQPHAPMHTVLIMRTGCHALCRVRSHSEWPGDPSSVFCQPEQVLPVSLPYPWLLCLLACPHTLSSLPPTGYIVLQCICCDCVPSTGLGCIHSSDVKHASLSHNSHCGDHYGHIVAAGHDVVRVLRGKAKHNRGNHWVAYPK